MVIGSTISHYRIVAKLGEGGMGVVYKAEDTKLERTVALKFLAEHLLSDTEAKERFLREAKAAAALHHSNVCPVHEIDEVDGKTFLAMAFLEGEPLEDRIAQGPLSIKDALDIARQVAEGLQAAHEKGIVHRDIKPANIMVDLKGHATIMDFGLARLTEASRLTKVDTAMGTVAYMSPEQAQGMEVDSRSDIWSLGCVMYEMVSGQRPFQGQYDQALLYEIVHEEIAPLTSVRAGVPMELEFIGGKCLAKDRDDRYQQASDIAVDLRTLGEKLRSGRSTILRTANLPGTVPATMTSAHTLNPAATLPPDAVIVKRRSQLALQGLAALLGVALLVLSLAYFTQAPPEKALRRFSFVPPPEIDASALTAGPVISPNGRHIAFTTAGSDAALWVQDLDEDEPRVIPGTAGANLPFWSPDSQFIAFATGAELRKISVQGGASAVICQLPSPLFFEGTWSSSDDLIVFGALHGAGISLFEVSAQGGDPTVLVTEQDLNGTRGYVSRPRYLPADFGRAIVFAVGDATQTNLYARNLDTGLTTELGPGDRPVYSPSTGYLLYQSQRNIYNIWARPFSPATLEFTGPALPVREAARQPSLSDDGTLAYMDGGMRTDVGLFWVDRSGQLEPESFIGADNSAGPGPSISPDGRSVAYHTAGEFWVQDLLRGTRIRLTDDANRGDNQSVAVWSPAGDRVAFGISGDGPARAVVRAADGSGEIASLYDGTERSYVTDWTRNDRVVLALTDPDTGFDMWYRESTPGGGFDSPRPFLQTAANEAAAKVSPNGRFIAYVSDESGRFEVYVQPFPEGGRRTAISTAGGGAPRWSRDGKELFYAEGPTLVSVAVSTDGDFSVGAATRLFQHIPSPLDLPNYDVSPEGERFIVNTGLLADDGAAPPKIRIVENWFEEFRNREQD